MSILYKKSNFKKPYIQVKLSLDSGYNTITSLLDTGSEISLINRGICEALPGNKSIVNCEKFSITGYGGTTLEIIDQYLEITIKIKSVQIINARFFITKQSTNIIGHDIITLLQNNNYNIFEAKRKLDNKVFSKNDYVLIPHSIKIIELDIPSVNKNKSENILIQPPRLDFDRIVLEEGITSTENPSLIIQNCSDFVFPIDKGDYLGRFQYIDTIETKDINFIQRISDLEDENYKRDLNEEREKFLKERYDNLANVKIDIDDLTIGPIESSEKKELIEIIYDYKIIFKQSSTDRGFTQYVEKLDFINGEPNFEALYTKPHKFTPMQMEAIEPEIQKLIDSKSITHCSSAANIPLFAVISVRPGSSVPKVRLVQNFKKLNAEISERKYPICSAQDILARAGKYIINKKKSSKEKIFFTGLDLASAFHMISLHRDDHLLTAFTFKDRQLCFTVVPFGVKNSPASFNYVLHKILEKILADNPGIFTYLDDILIIGTAKETLAILRQIFESFKINGVVCTLNKCNFLEEEIVFLGKKVTKMGVSELKKQLDRIFHFERPTTIRQVQKFLGLCCYVLSRVPYLNSTLSPLHALVGKKVFVWETEHEAAFRAAQDLMQNAIETSHFDPKATVFVCSDTSKASVGYSLGNEFVENGEIVRKICILGSKKIPEKLVTASSRTLEVYGILLSLKILRWSLLGIKDIKVYSDNTSAVAFLKNPKNLIDPIIPQRIRNLFPLFMELSVQLIYLEDKNPLLGLSDYLSRNSINDCEVSYLQTQNSVEVNLLKTRMLSKNLMFLDIKLADIKNNQSNDEFTLKLKQMTAKESPLKFRNKFYRTDNEGTLICGPNENNIDLIVVPECLQEHMINQIHIIFLHCGYNKVIMEVRKQKLFIPKIHSVLDTVIARCIACQLQKTPRKALQMSQPKIPTVHPFEHFEMDLFSTERWDIRENFVLVVVDRFSKFIFAEPLLSKNSFEVARKLVKIIMTNGFELSTFNSDNGLEFSGIVEEVSKILPLTRFTTSPFNPQSNGVSEYSNFRIKMGLQQSVLSTDNFESTLAMMVAKINRSPHKGLCGLSPFEVFFGRSRPLLIPENPVKFKEVHKGSEIQHWLSLVSQTRNEIAEIGLMNYHESIKNFCEPNEVKLKRNDIVITLANCGHTPGRKSGPLDFIGPFIIARVKTNRVVIRCPLTGRTLNRNFRIVRKLNLSDDDRKKILHGRFSMHNGQLSLTDSEDKTIESARMKRTDDSNNASQSSKHNAVDHGCSSNKKDLETLKDPVESQNKDSNKNESNLKDDPISPSIQETLDRWSGKKRLRSQKRVNYKV